MDKPAQLRRKHISADDGILVNQQSGLDAGFPRRVIADFIGIQFDPLAAIFRQIEALGGLELQVLGVAVIEALRNE